MYVCICWKILFIVILCFYISNNFIKTWFVDRGASVIITWWCFLSPISHKTTQTAILLPVWQHDCNYTSNPPFSHSHRWSHWKGAREGERKRGRARFVIEEWTRWRKKLVVAKQARAFSPSRSLIAWMVLTMPVCHPCSFPLAPSSLHYPRHL